MLQTWSEKKRLGEYRDSLELDLGPGGKAEGMLGRGLSRTSGDRSLVQVLFGKAQPGNASLQGCPPVSQGGGGALGLGKDLWPPPGAWSSLSGRVWVVPCWAHPPATHQVFFEVHYFLLHILDVLQ